MPAEETEAMCARVEGQEGRRVRDRGVRQSGFETPSTVCQPCDFG